MNQISTFLTCSLALAGSLLVVAPAKALDLSFAGKSGNDYTFNVTIDSNESISDFNNITFLPDFLTLRNLSGVTNATANSPYRALTTTDATRADFEVDFGARADGPANLTSVITITSPDTLGTITYDASYEESGFGRFISSTVDTSTSVAVPFGPKADLGIFTILGIFGFSRLRKKLKSE